MSFNTGQWSDTEHNLLIKGVQLFDNSWRKLSLYIKTRSSSQIRSHVQKFIKKVALRKKIYFVNNDLERLKIKLDNVFPYRRDLYKTFIIFKNYLPKKMKRKVESSSEKSIDDKFQKVHSFTLEAMEGVIKKEVKIYDNEYLATQLVNSFTVFGRNSTMSIIHQQISEVKKNLTIICELTNK